MVAPRAPPRRRAGNFHLYGISLQKEFPLIRVFPLYGISPCKEFPLIRNAPTRRPLLVSRRFAHPPPRHVCMHVLLLLLLLLVTTTTTTTATNNSSNNSNNSNNNDNSTTTTTTTNNHDDNDDNDINVPVRTESLPEAMPKRPATTEAASAGPHILTDLHTFTCMFITCCMFVMYDGFFCL